ncbi:hypothetical protein CCP4SC76_5750005 [Gammaproteobacteria bacterium]
MRTGKITRHIRHMRRFGDSQQIIWLKHPDGKPYHYALQKIDWMEPSCGGAVEAEKRLFNDPMLIFQWALNHRVIFDDKRLAQCSNWMKGYTNAQRCWLRRVLPNHTENYT